MTDKPDTPTDTPADVGFEFCKIVVFYPSTGEYGDKLCNTFFLSEHEAEKFAESKAAYGIPCAVYSLEDVCRQAPHFKWDSDA